MKTFGTSIAAKERWISIAGTVTDKTAKECFTRYKELCAKAKK